MIGWLWLGATIGMTFIVTRAPIFAPLRALFPKKKGQAPFFGTLLRCPKCFGTWMGAAWGLVLAWMQGRVIRVDEIVYIEPSPIYLGIYAFACGTAGAAVCWLADLVFRKLGGDKVLAHERHPWQDVPAELRAEVHAVLGRHAEVHASVAQRATNAGSEDGMDREMKDVLAADARQRAKAYETALDALGP